MQLVLYHTFLVHLYSALMRLQIVASHDSHKRAHHGGSSRGSIVSHVPIEFTVTPQKSMPYCAVMSPATILMTPSHHLAGRAPAVESSGGNYRHGDALGGESTTITPETILDFASILWNEVRTLIISTA
jgi:hypothetical protein